MSRMRGFPPLLLILSVFLPGPVWAQSIIVEVVSSEDDLPLQGSFVSLLNSVGNEVRSALTDARGRQLFVLPDAGVFRIRAEMIGRETVESPSITVEEGEAVHHRLRLPSQAIELEELRVEAGRVCQVRPERASAIARIWEEARKALRVLAWGDSLEVFRYRVERYARALDLDGRTVSEESRESRAGYFRAPFESRPAAELIEQGFVEKNRDGDLFFAPDAAVVLSDPFLNTHCMALAPPDQERHGTVGLAFEPVPGRRLPEISGTFWLDGDSGELLQLDYRYENLDSPIQDPRIGGMVDFGRLPNGHWMVKRWFVRMPTIGIAFRGQPFREPILSGFREEGGQVISVTDASGSLILEAERATIEGIVLDEQDGSPQVGVSVRLVGTDHQTTTDGKGEFRFTGAAEGVYQILAVPRLAEELGAEIQPIPVNAIPGEVTPVRLSTPSTRVLVKNACTDLVQSDTPVVIVGQVRDEISGRPISDAKVELWWNRLQGEPGAFQPALLSESERAGHWLGLWDGSRSGIEARSGQEGEYAICGPTSEHSLSVLATFGSLSTDTVSVRVPAGDILATRDLTIRTDGTGSLTGVVVDLESDEPLENAQVTLDGAGRMELTDRRGMFRFEDIPLGGHVISVEMLGRATAVDSVVIGPGQAIQVEVRLPPEAIELEGIVVEVMRGAVDASRTEGRALDVVSRARLAELEPRVHDLTGVLRREVGNRLRITASPASSGIVSEFCVQSSRRTPSPYEMAEWPGCRPVMLIVDGVTVWAPVSNLEGSMPQGQFRDLLSLPPDQIENVQLLSPMEGRFRYGKLGRFGVLIVNTRRGGPGRG